MKPTHNLLFIVAAALLTFSTASLLAEDWKTSDGKVYQDVKVVGLQADAVTILHQYGGASIPLANLPPDLQKRFNYDPAKARAAAEARAKEDAVNAQALQAEMNLASEMRQAGSETPDAGATRASASPAKEDTTSEAQVYGDSTHHSIFELSNSAHSLKSDPADTNHHSIDDLTASAQSLRPDLSDPTYHTMAHLVYTINQDGLGPDSSDPNHHTISEVTGSLENTNPATGSQ